MDPDSYAEAMRRQAAAVAQQKEAAKQAGKDLQQAVNAQELSRRQQGQWKAINQRIDNMNQSGAIEPTQRLSWGGPPLLQGKGLPAGAYLVDAKGVIKPLDYNPCEAAPMGELTNLRAQTSAQMRLIAEAKEELDELRAALEGVQKEPLLLRRPERIDNDGRLYVKKGEDEIRIEAPGAPLWRALPARALTLEDEVLLHPKSYQVVEVLGPRPLGASPFAVGFTPTAWEDLGGLEGAKGDLQEAVELPYLHRGLFAAYGAKSPKGILLAGPPGCGKTMLGRAAATSLAKLHGASAGRTGFLYVKGPELLDQFVGQTERAIRDLFSDARRHHEAHGYPALVFIDEADAILGARGTGMQTLGTVVPTFLTEMDGLSASSALVVLATNRPEALDPAIVRDGRVDRKVLVARPSRQTGEGILLRALRGTPLEDGLDPGVVASELAEEIYSPNRLLREDATLASVVSGALLVNAVQIAVGFALRRDIRTGSTLGSTGRPGMMMAELEAPLGTPRPSGLCLEDCFAAVDRLQAQSQVVRHDVVEVGFSVTMRKDGGQ